ncbi:hypothetical protein WJX73_005142 [Symbiochloris irregularis]|uniref:Uncharacterized protein n=1 Tax=Symbiochloris irregularis TaxID=706552 RepID=A0AAW1NN20_9CHLO
MSGSLGEQASTVALCLWSRNAASFTGPGKSQSDGRRRTNAPGAEQKSNLRLLNRGCAHFQPNSTIRPDSCTPGRLREAAQRCQESGAC